MKVLSLLQPWASLVVMGVKKFEVRSWRTAYRGPLLIHASARRPSKREQLFFQNSEYFRDHIDQMDQLPYGMIIGRTELAGIYATEWLIQNPDIETQLRWEKEFAFDDYSAGRFAWHLLDVVQLKHPLPVKGSLGLWEYNGLLDDVEQSGAF